MTQAQTYKITAARNDGERDNPHGGKLVKWYLRVADSEAGDAEIYCQKKPGNDLDVGMEITGRLAKEEYGWRLYPDAQQQGGAPRRGNSSAPQGGGMSKDDYWRNKDQRDIEGIQRMGRAHAQEMALRWMDLPDNARPALPGAKNGGRTVLVDVIDWFENDVDVGGGSSPAPGDPPAADVSAEQSLADTEADLTELKPGDIQEASPPAEGPSHPGVQQGGVQPGRHEGRRPLPLQVREGDQAGCLPADRRPSGRGHPRAAPGRDMGWQAGGESSGDQGCRADSL